MKLSFFCLFLMPMTAFGINHDQQIWANLNSFIALTPKWQAYLEVQPRLVNYHSQHGTSLYRAALGRNLGNNLSAWIGYAFIERTYPSYLHEDRPFLQLLHSHAMTEELKIINRSRLESRFFWGSEEPGFRLRHLLRGQYTFPGSAIGLVMYDEWFWHGNSVNDSLGVREGFDQNRFFFGPMILFGEKKQNLFEVGYLHQYVSGKRADASNHNLAVQLTLRF